MKNCSDQALPGEITGTPKNTFETHWTVWIIEIRLGSMRCGFFKNPRALTGSKLIIYIYIYIYISRKGYIVL